MRNRRVDSALERRYDGPIPPTAAVPPDHASPWDEQLSHRRSWAWADVRRIGHLTLRANRAFRATRNGCHFGDWIRLRRELASALRSWAAYRDWTRAKKPDSGVSRPARSDRPPRTL